MGTIRFSDNIEFDTSGELRLTRCSDGWYVVGEGMLIPVKDKEEGLEIIQQETKLAKGYGSFILLFNNF